MTSEVDGCLWISPSQVSAKLPLTSAQRFAATMATCCEVVVIGLQVWEMGLADPCEIATEVAAVRRVAADRGWHRYHLFGFSAGATVALATARADPDAVRTLALVEPATIGDDAWSPVEKRWRHDLSRVRRLPFEQRQPAFRRMLLMPGQSMPSGLGPPPLWDVKTDKLEDLLARTGFDTGDLRDLIQPTLAMSGAQSHPRFVRLAERLVEVMPHARASTLPGCSHLSPPHRVVPDQLATALTRLWASVE